MARKLTAEELREKAKENLRKELAKAKKIELKELAGIGAKIKQFALSRNVTVEELLDCIEREIAAKSKNESTEE